MAEQTGSLGLEVMELDKDFTQNLSLAAANEYVKTYALNIEDWNEADDDTKFRYMNIAEKTLKRKYPNYTIPSNAIYEFASTLLLTFNDTNKLSQQGIASFSLQGVVTYTFDGKTRKPLSEMITEEVFELINEEPANANLPKVSNKRRFIATVL